MPMRHGASPRLPRVTSVPPKLTIVLPMPAALSAVAKLSSAIARGSAPKSHCTASDGP
jgi:hypothetical protein